MAEVRLILNFPVLILEAPQVHKKESQSAQFYKEKYHIKFYIKSKFHNVQCMKQYILMWLTYSLQLYRQ